MHSMKNLKKDFVSKQKEADKAKMIMLKEELNKKLDCVTDIVINNESLCKEIISLPRDEVKVVMTDIICSPAFDELFKVALNSEKLASLRASKGRRQKSVSIKVRMLIHLCVLKTFLIVKFR